MRTEDEVRHKVHELDKYIARFSLDLGNVGDDEPDAIMLRTEVRDLEDVKHVLLWVLGEAPALQI